MKNLFLYGIGFAFGFYFVTRNKKPVIKVDSLDNPKKILVPGSLFAKSNLNLTAKDLEHDSLETNPMYASFDSLPDELKSRIVSPNLKPGKYYEVS